MGGEAGPVKIRTGKAPQHRAVPRSRQPAEDAGGKGGGKRAVLFVAAHPEDLVQGPPCEPAARQGSINRGNAERQDPMDRCRRPLDPLDALAQLRKAGSLLDHVPFLFFFLFLSTRAMGEPYAVCFCPVSEARMIMSSRRWRVTAASKPGVTSLPSRIPSPSFA